MYVCLESRKVDVTEQKYEKNYVLKIAERNGYEIKPLIMSSLILKHLDRSRGHPLQEKH